MITICLSSCRRGLQALQPHCPGPDLWQQDLALRTAGSEPGRLAFGSCANTSCVRGQSFSNLCPTWVSVWVLNKAGHPSFPTKPDRQGKGYQCFIVQQRPHWGLSLSVPQGSWAGPCPNPKCPSPAQPQPSAGRACWGPEFMSMKHRQDLVLGPWLLGGVTGQRGGIRGPPALEPGARRAPRTQPAGWSPAWQIRQDVCWGGLSSELFLPGRSVSSAWLRWRPLVASAQQLWCRRHLGPA